jgi:hypothetical protein
MTHWGGPCSLCGNPDHDGPTFPLTLEDLAWQSRVCGQMNAAPGLAPRHAIMFAQIEDQQEAAREAALEWEREKGRAFEEGRRSAEDMVAPMVAQSSPKGRSTHDHG